MSTVNLTLLAFAAERPALAPCCNDTTAGHPASNGLPMEESIRMTEDRDNGMEKLRPSCGQPSDRGWLKNSTEPNGKAQFWEFLAHRKALGGPMQLKQITQYADCDAAPKWLLSQ